MRGIALIFAVLMIACNGCGPSAAIEDHAASTNSGVHGIAATAVQTDANGMTVEQHNIQQRLLADNKPGAIKHLYVISAFSGQVLIYSTVRGKVTSSGKRLNPMTVSAAAGQYNSQGDYIPIDVNGLSLRTSEVLQDDGTYGSSDPYLYWWDAKGVYHQHYVTGGQIVHISDQPLAIKSVVINMEAGAQ